MNEYVAGALTGFGLGLFGLAGALAIIGNYPGEAFASLMSGIAMLALGLAADVKREARRRG